MSSVNEQLVPPPKPRLSPLEFRNTDLVSRLLAATPPYLYNMSLLPNTYFFSEMLRSFVQAKTEVNRSSHFQARRARKRPWNTVKNESHTKPETSPKLESTEWKIYPEHKLTSESPLELTTTPDNDQKPNSNPPQLDPEPMFPTMSQETHPSGLILPPPPPIWYPPLYPTANPYGIDPLHFFIDLRVSGHIYDRKNRDLEPGKEAEPKQISVKDGFKPSRHASAFSVPTPRSNRPINLSHSEEQGQDSKSLKFDVKSMGFEKTSNKIGTNYVMNNIGNIYKCVNEQAQNFVKSEASPTSETSNENDNETEEEKQKRVKDLRALIGLELVVDYMNHAKPQPRKVNENSFGDLESAGSPTLEVVALET